MPTKPQNPCRHPGCPRLTHETYCEVHAKRCDNHRPSASRRGYDNRWRKARARYLREHTFCRSCEENGRLVKATVVDHIQPHRGNTDLFWDETNWQPLCKPCHDRKTVLEDGIPEYSYW
ncbi:MAG: HNH endonuclease signature motif containing protein [Bacillota bacterium]|nr:HNH endonuclease signature motif containing protein [Bacillota bacterium]MDW7677834.1 HNH endonuclease signature motif containing protein [Bacillota bacterium]